MTGDERKRAFRVAAAEHGATLSAAAVLGCGVTWEHLSRGLSDDNPTPLSMDVKTKFAAYVGRSVEEIFGANAEDEAA
jgi:hypothetical protein